MKTSLRVAATVALSGVFILGACSDDTSSGRPDQGPGTDQQVQPELGATDGGGETTVKQDVGVTPDLSSVDLSVTVDSIQNCTVCHSTPPATGRHNKHISKGLKCATCHSEVVDANMKIINATLHNNGTKNVKGTFSWDGTGCSSNGCHGNRNW